MAARVVPEGETTWTVRANIIRLRQTQGMSMERLLERVRAAGRTNLHYGGLHALIHGSRRIDVDDLGAFAEAFGVDPAALLAPLECDHCDGEPPAGYDCQGCGARGRRAERQAR
jgi:transcriptional regulator with XRE-family HTH domain